MKEAFEKTILPFVIARGSPEGETRSDLRMRLQAILMLGDCFGRPEASGSPWQ